MDMVWYPAHNGAIKLTRAKYDLREKAAIIIGAARSLGLAFAEALAAAGCNIAVLDILSEASSALYDLQTKYSIVTRYYRVDITS